MLYKHGWLVLPRFSVAVDTANPFFPYLMPILLWLLAASIAMVVSPQLDDALGLWRAYFIQPLLIFGMVVLTFRHRTEKVWLLWSLGVSVLIIGFTTILQGLGVWSIPEPFASAEVFRATGLYPYPNAVGLFVGPIVAMYVAWTLQRLDRETLPAVVFKSLVIAFGLVAIVLSFTKGALVGVAIGALVTAFTIDGWRRRILFVGTFFVILMIFLVPGLRHEVINQATLNSPSGLMRQAVWEETFYLLKDKPIFGAGLAGYQIAVAPYHVDWRPEITPYKIETYLYPHNIFLNAWVELGLLGLIAFVWLLIIFYKLAWQQRSMPLSAMAMIAMTGLVIHGLVDVPYFKNDLAILFWLIMALPLLERRRIHHMHLHPEPYQMVLTGHKTVEVRLNDPKRRQVVMGDIIVFYPHRNAYESIHVVVEEVISRETFLDLFEHINPTEAGEADIKSFINSLAKYYNDEDEKRHGAVAFRIKKIG
jgi:O-antigen ligase/ASC-1-like (ASCH) protein